MFYNRGHDYINYNGDEGFAKDQCTSSAPPRELNITIILPFLNLRAGLRQGPK